MSKVGDGDVNLDGGTVVPDVKQCNLLGVVHIVSTVVGYLLVQSLEERSQCLHHNIKIFISLKHWALAICVDAQVCLLSIIKDVPLPLESWGPRKGCGSWCLCSRLQQVESTLECTFEAFKAIIWTSRSAS